MQLLFRALKNLALQVHVAKDDSILGDGGGGGVLAEKLGRGVRPASQNPYPIYDQNLRFSIPHL